MQETRMVEKAEMYRAASRRLLIVKARWWTLPREKRLRQMAIDHLVENTEGAIDMLMPPSQSLAAVISDEGDDDAKKDK
jgi:hypothetical protein